MGEKYTFTGIEPERPNTIGSRYRASDFKKGEYVRLFLAYATNQDITIREGVVVSTNKKKKSRLMNEDCIDIRVVASGYLERRNPIDVTVANADGSYVSGQAQVIRLMRPNTSRFAYRCISYAQRRE